MGTSLVVQWLRLHAPNPEGLGSVPGQGTRPHIPQLKRFCMLQLRCNTAKIKINLKKKKCCCFLKSFYWSTVVDLQCCAGLRKVNQLYMHLLFFRFYFHTGDYRVPHTILQSLLLSHLIYRSVNDRCSC